MFILRLIEKDGRESNLTLGRRYCIVYKVVSEFEFEKCFNSWLGECKTSAEIKENIFAFISANQGEDLIPLRKDQTIYVMTDGGKTFSNLTR